MYKSEDEILKPLYKSGKAICPECGNQMLYRRAGFKSDRVTVEFVCPRILNQTRKQHSQEFYIGDVKEFKNYKESDFEYIVTPFESQNLCINSNRIESTNKLICESDCGFECENRRK
jgi:predicted RNA-binding Zn-ribbon protein involved in translation (DUF1610 family)